MRFPVRTLLPLAVSLAILLLPAARAQLVVTTTVDEDDGDALPDNGAGTSLREAVNHAQPNATVTFASALSGQTLLVLGPHISVLKSVTIDASALPDGVIIDGRGQTRLFVCGSQTTNRFIGLTLTGGSHPSAGGAILNNGELTLDECTLIGNTASEGGAAFNFGDLTLNNCAVVGNHARFGGAFEEDGGTLTLNNCTVTGNSAEREGGAILNLFTVILNNSTVTGNVAGDGGEFGGWGGGISNCDTLRLHNSIVAGNTADGGTNIGGTISSSTGGNLTSGDPMLAPFGDYGGRTWTMPPLPGSPAIDAGGPTVLASDQRGFPRTTDGDGDMAAATDIGAAEYMPAADLAAFWPLDWDGDRNTFGVEHALGTDPLAADAGSARNFTATLGAAGEIELAFALSPDAAAARHTAWTVTRSPDLSPGSFVEIYRLDGPTMTESIAVGVQSVIDPSTASVTITDRTPPAPRAFYRLGAELVPAAP